MSWEWIVFDAAGTLFVPDPHPAEVYLRVADAAGAFDHRQMPSISEMQDRLAQAMVTHFAVDRAAEPTDESREHNRWRAIVSDCFPNRLGSWFDEAFETLWRHFALAENWKVYPDVAETIALARGTGAKIAVASNFDDRLHQVIDGLSVTEWFDEVLVSSELGWSKPNIKFYHKAARRLDLTSSSAAIMIGDTLQGDVIAARQAGWHARHLIRDAEDSLSVLMRRIIADNLR